MRRRYSTDLLRNRVSDFCGWIQFVWDWLGNILELGVLGTVVWFTWTEDLGNAVYWIVALGLFFWVTTIVLSWACKLITGRYPGQARNVRKLLTQWLNSWEYE